MRSEFSFRFRCCCMECRYVSIPTNSTVATSPSERKKKCMEISRRWGMGSPLDHNILLLVVINSVDYFITWIMQ